MCLHIAVIIPMTYMLDNFLKNITDFSVSIHVLYMPFDLLSTTFFSRCPKILFLIVYNVQNEKQFIGAGDGNRTHDFSLEG